MNLCITKVCRASSILVGPLRPTPVAEILSSYLHRAVLAGARCTAAYATAVCSEGASSLSLSFSCGNASCSGPSHLSVLRGGSERILYVAR